MKTPLAPFLVAAVVICTRAGDLEIAMFPRAWDTTAAQGVTFADLNGDGLLDMIAASATSNLYTRLGNGDGTFGPEIANVTNHWTAFPVVADFDADGKLDVVTVHFGLDCDYNDDCGNWIFVSFGNGDGTLDPALQIDPGNSGLRNVAVGDFDENDAPDILVARGSNGVQLHLGTGTGEFLPYQDLTPEEPSGWVAVDDFDGDGHQDFASGNWEGEVLIHLGNGDGTFTAAGSQTAGPSWVAQVVSGDLDRDGIPDLVVTVSGADSLLVLRGKGDGTFDPVESVPVPPDPWAVTIADVDDDSAVDLVVGHRAYGNDLPLTLLRGTGEGGFDLPEAVGHTLAWADTISVVDLDRDGDQDIVFSRLGAESVLLRNRGDGTFPTYVASAADESASRMVVDDANEDGVPDLLVAPPDPAAGIFVMFGNGDGSFTQSDEVGPGQIHSAFLAAELGEGLGTDVASVDQYSDVVRVYPGLGGGTFGPGSSWDVGTRPRSLAVGDLDGDDDLDLVVGNHGSHDVSVLLQETVGFAPEVRYGSGIRPAVVALGDLDEDTNLDLVVAIEGSPAVAVHLGQGDGAFGGPTSYPFGLPGEKPDSMALLDFDGDGTLDVLVAAAPNPVLYHHLWFFAGDGSGGLLPGVELPAPDARLLADLDGDGRSDAVGQGDVSLGNGDGTLQSPFQISFLPYVAADFNGDGRADLARLNLGESPREIRVMLNECLSAALRLTASDQAFGWREMCGAQQYDVYRREFASALEDANEDGLPDEGYGECVNDLDDDTVDTMFADPEIPLPGGNGFAYLVGWVDLEGDRGLGTTSAGLPREDVVPCP